MTKSVGNKLRTRVTDEFLNINVQCKQHLFYNYLILSNYIVARVPCGILIMHMAMWKIAVTFFEVICRYVFDLIYSIYLTMISQFIVFLFIIESIRIINFSIIFLGNNNLYMVILPLRLLKVKVMFFVKKI